MLFTIMTDSYDVMTVLCYRHSLYS